MKIFSTFIPIFKLDLIIEFKIDIKVLYNFWFIILVEKN